MVSLPSLAVGVHLFFSCVSDLRWYWSTPTGGEATEYSCCGAIHLQARSVMSPTVHTHRLYCFWHCSQPDLNCRCSSSWLWLLSGQLFSSGHQPGFTEVRIAVIMHLDPLCYGDSSAWPIPQVLEPPEPPAAIARPISFARAVVYV